MLRASKVEVDLEFLGLELVLGPPGRIYNPTQGLGENNGSSEPQNHCFSSSAGLKR